MQIDLNVLKKEKWICDIEFKKYNFFLLLIDLLNTFSIKHMPGTFLGNGDRVKEFCFLQKKKKTEIFNSNGEINLKINASVIWHRFKYLWIKWEVGRQIWGIEKNENHTKVKKEKYRRQ